MSRHSIMYLVLAIMCSSFSLNIVAQKRPAKAKLGKICGNPQIKCRTGDTVFQKHEIGFESPKNNTVIYDSEPFYAIILKTVRLNSKVSCENAISEDERLEIQKMFAENKVFALKCSDAGEVYYTNIADNVNFIAVYAGKTQTEADSFLKTVKATGKFKGAIIRRMQAGINGT